MLGWFYPVEKSDRTRSYFVYVTPYVESLVVRYELLTEVIATSTNETIKRETDVSHGASLGRGLL